MNDAPGSNAHRDLYRMRQPPGNERRKNRKGNPERKLMKLHHLRKESQAQKDDLLEKQLTLLPMVNTIIPSMFL